jgi:hypothetical protein
VDPGNGSCFRDIRYHKDMWARCSNPDYQFVCRIQIELNRRRTRIRCIRHRGNMEDCQMKRTRDKQEPEKSGKTRNTNVTIKIDLI